ncbi:hypothetical protein [Kluyvera georgiana]|uniref:hypothetical protein n=1 Tax=Kluyvera georgiana TaxID=73098 RepID=UPI000807056E|nr:hypothetical protein [Kluyvera georgiana]
MKQPTIYGVGYNDTREHKLTTEYHSSFEANLKRVYSHYWIVDNRPSYILATTSEDFLYESNYVKFREANYYTYISPISGKEESPDLDKDILLPGNKHYSYDLVAYVPKFVNQAMTEKESDSQLPLGVSELKDGYKMTITKFGKTTSEKGFATAMDAHRKWQEEKMGYLINVAEAYKEVTPTDKFNINVYEAVLDKARQIMNEYDKGIDTRSKNVEGVEYKDGKFISFIIYGGEKTILGVFDDVMDAHRTWQEMIIDLLICHMDQMKERDKKNTVFKLQETLAYYQQRIDKVQNDIDNNLITVCYYKD